MNKFKFFISIIVSPIVLALLSTVATASGTSVLLSWNDSESRTNIIEFVEAVTNKSSPDYVPVTERIAVFDNDGTLWSEKPVYFQLLFAIDRVKALAPEHPEWRTTQPFKAVLENDMDALAESGEAGLLELVMATHAGNTTDEFSTIVTDWRAKTNHPRLPYRSQSLLGALRRRCRQSR